MSLIKKKFLPPCTMPFYMKNEEMRQRDRRVVSRVQVAFFKGRKKGVEISLRKFDRREVLITQHRFEGTEKNGLKHKRKEDQCFNFFSKK